jgi:hypothetical protein
VSWVEGLEHPLIVDFKDVMRLSPDPSEDNYLAHAPLEEAFQQVVRALALIFPETFDDLARFNISCRMGSGGIPYDMVVEWHGDEITVNRVTIERELCTYDRNTDTLRMFIDEDDRISNAGSCSTMLRDSLLGIRGTSAPWFPKAGKLEEESNGIFGRRLRRLIRELLRTQPDDWLYINIEGRDYGSKLADVEWEPFGRLFESNSLYTMKLELFTMYTGCQICGLVTPRSERGTRTEESIKHIISQRGGQYRAKRDLSHPLGRLLWLCPRHRILWERKLIKFCFMEEAFDGTYSWRGGKESIPRDVKRAGLETLREMRDDWAEGATMPIEVYDQTVDFRGSRSLDPRWNQLDLRVTKKHAMDILDKMRSWVSD